MSKSFQIDFNLYLLYTCRVVVVLASIVECMMPITVDIVTLSSAVFIVIPVCNTQQFYSENTNKTV